MKKISKEETDNSPEAKKFPLPIYSEDEDIYKKEKEVAYDEDELGNAPKVKLKIKKPGEKLPLV